MLLGCRRSEAEGIRGEVQGNGNLEVWEPSLSWKSLGPEASGSCATLPPCGLGSDCNGNTRRSPCFFLFTQVFKWTGHNSFFVKGDLDSLMMGSGRCVSLSPTSWGSPCPSPKGAAGGMGRLPSSHALWHQHPSPSPEGHMLSDILV